MKVSNFGAFKFSNYGQNGSIDDGKYQTRFLDEIAYNQGIYFCKFYKEEIEAIDKLIQRYDDKLDDFQITFGIEPYTLAVTIFNKIKAFSQELKDKKITWQTKLLVKIEPLVLDYNDGEYYTWEKFQKTNFHCFRVAKQKNDIDLSIPLPCVKILYHLDARITNAEAADIFTKLLLPKMQMRTNFEENRDFNNIEVYMTKNYQREVYAR
jgi:hypothetical protein